MAQNLEKTTANNCAADRAFSCLTIFFNQDVLVEISGLLHPPSARLPRKMCKSRQSRQKPPKTAKIAHFGLFLTLFSNYFQIGLGNFRENSRRIRYRSAPPIGNVFTSRIDCQMAHRGLKWQKMDQFGPFLGGLGPLWRHVTHFLGGFFKSDDHLCCISLCFPILYN